MSKAENRSDANNVAAAILLSRVFGLLREAFIGATLGLTAAAVAFRLAMRIPNIIQNLLGEGALGASFVPVYARLLEDENDIEARRVAGGVLGFLLAVIAATVAGIVLAAGPLVSVLGAGLDPDTQDLATSLTRITAAGVGLLGVSAWSLAILNSHRQYFLGYAAPVAWNVVQIGLLGTVAVFGLAETGPDGATDHQKLATWLALAVLVGSALQLGVMLPRVAALTDHVLPHLGREGETGTVLRRFLPAVGARGVVQLSGFIDLFLAGLLASGAVALLSLVQPLYLLPISVFGFSVATTELTEMSRQSAKTSALARRVGIGLRKVTLAAGVCTAIFAFGGDEIAQALYRWPSQLLGTDLLNSDQNRVIGLTLAAYALALPASMSARISQNALFALGDTRTPARIALVRLVAMVVASVLFMFQLDRLEMVDGVVRGWGDLPHWAFWEPLPTAARHIEGQARLGPIGLGVGALCASSTEWLLLRRALEQQLRRPVSSGMAFPVFAASLGAGVCVWLVASFSALPGPLGAVAVGVVGLAAYIGLLRFQGLKPLTP
ncbi:MAG: hypothetical protein O3C27_03505 [Actinomycetota bacterium]|nr:hypothetical protein [Actinomycetota bacterium]